MPGMAIGAVARNAEHAMAGHRLARRQIADHQRQHRAERRGERPEDERVLQRELGRRTARRT